MKSKKSRFANRIIAVCVTVGALVTAATVGSYYLFGMPIPAEVVSALLLFWGGELLIVALRQVFGSDVVKKGGESLEKYETETFKP